MICTNLNLSVSAMPVLLVALATGCNLEDPDEADFRGLGLVKIELSTSWGDEVGSSSSGECSAGAFDMGTPCGGNSTGGAAGETTFGSIAYCGDGLLDWGEQCDDGNTYDGDGCSSVCTLDIIVFTTGLETGGSSDSVGWTDSGTGGDGGDGTNGSGGDPGSTSVSDPEDSTADPGDGSGSGASSDPSGGSSDTGGSSGTSGASDTGGSSDTSGGCLGLCTDGVCGDGVVQPLLDEQCDDGNLEDGDGCSAACILESCGDGVLQEGFGEGCDDGNTDDGDGCDAGCIAEVVCPVVMPPDTLAEVGGTAGPLPFGWHRFAYDEFFPESALSLPAVPYGPDNHAAAENSTVGIRVKASYHWNYSTIPYTFTNALPGACKTIVNEAVAQWNKDVKGVKWVPRGLQDDYVAFSNGADEGTFDSKIGRQGGEQLVRLGGGSICNAANTPSYKGMLLHEMMHAAGFDHEQCRIDRDNHVNVVFDNIVSNYKHNYENHGTWRGWEDSGNYDFDSIMHYGDTFFQKPGKGFTMSRKVGGGRIHSHNVMTKDDIAALDSLYGAAPDILAWADGGNFIRKKYADAVSRCSGAGYTIPSKVRVLAHWVDITKLLDVAKTPACVWISEPADAGRHWILHFKSADEANEGIESSPNGGTCTVLCTRNP